jgi:hypothetical protein
MVLAEMEFLSCFAARSCADVDFSMFVLETSLKVDQQVSMKKSSQ